MLALLPPRSKHPPDKGVIEINGKNRLVLLTLGQGWGGDSQDHHQHRDQHHRETHSDLLPQAAKTLPSVQSKESDY